MSLHKITAGSGYDYLTRQVAVQDTTEKGHLGLASYYTERGETPGQWLGSGMVGIDGLDAGDVVTAEQMQNLFGAGLHPLAQQRMDALHGPGLTEADYLAVSRLGSPFKIHANDVSPFRVEVAKRLAALNLLEGAPARSTVAADERARIRTEVGREFFRAEFGRDPVDARELAGLIAKLSRPQTTAIAGFDLTFSPVKSVSTLWALADPQTAAIIERAHHAAIADALKLIEDHALFTRTGAKGVRQVNVRGLVAAAFTHRDSRAGDPDLHTHVAVANKVQTLDGRWLSIDGRVLFKAKVTASETYNTALERHLADALGVQFVDRTTQAGRRPVREIDGVDPALNRRWSARRRSIEQREAELASEFQAAYGRPPTAIETLALAQQANLETRQDKHEPRTLTEQRTAWRTQAEQVLGGPDGIRRMIHTALHPTRFAGPMLDDAWFTGTAASIVATVEGSRATWQSWHVRAEAQRRARTANVPTTLLQATVDRLVAVALAEHSTPLAVPDDGVREPAVLRRVDGQSVYTVAGAELFTSPRIVAAEQRLVDAAARRDGMVVDEATIAVALLESTANGVELNAGQVALVRAMAGSGARVQVAIAPAGSGKTTAMRALATAWTEAGGTVLGLAPSAAAAAALGAQIDSHTDTLAKLTWSIDHQHLPDWAAQIGPKTLVVIDEAGMADTLSLDAAVAHILARGGSVRLIGDDQQLAAIGAGGVLRDIATSHGAARLNELVRFADPAEGGASLALRDGQTEALGFYLDRQRVHVGDLATITNQVFDAWQADRTAGLDTIMLAPTRDLVAELNTRARTHRLHDRAPGREVELADGLTASIGDVIITRTNDRRLRVSPTDWVKNGDRWTITGITPTGSVRALHTRSHLSVMLDADYVAASVELGYASTVHTAQGVSVDTMHGVATGTEGRQQLYTMLTRGRHANHVYLQVVGDGDPHTLIHPDTVRPPTATDILEQILARDTAPTSATSLQQQLEDPRLRLGQAVARYADALTVAAEDLAGDLAVRALERQVDQILPGVPWCDAWPALRAHLLLIAADGHDPLTELRTVAARTDLTGATDPAAVLGWRLDPTGLRNTTPGPLPWLPSVPSRLREHPEWGTHLGARARLVADLADTVNQQALTPQNRTPAWLASCLGQPTGQTIADLTVWRAAMNVPDTDLRPTGERQFPTAAARWQRHLDHRLTGDHQPAMAEWGPLLHQLAPHTTGDAVTPMLASRLAQLSASGLDARRLLLTAASEGNLPDDHPAAALWWRIARHLTPAVTGALDTDQPLTPAWTGSLADTVGADRAAELQASRWWPALVTAVDHGIRQGWMPGDLLTSTPAGHGQVDACLALVWRISMLTHPPTAADGSDEGVPDPDGEPPADLWDGYQPTNPILIGDPHELAATVAVDPIEPVASVADADDEGPSLAWEAMIRESLGVPEPTSHDLEKMLARADAWRDSPHTPERLAEVNRLTADYYQACYPDSWAQPYLAERFGVDLTGHPDLQPGYAPAGWTTLVTHLRRQGISDAEMLASGVATTASTGRLIDRFRDRAVFPIRHDGIVLGFVGRRHPQRTDDHAGPKYLNTGETLLFHKGDQLFTTGSLPPDVTPVIVEGPMDAIAVTLATGGTYVGVAPLGTSLTDDQAAQLRQHGHRTPIVATDADLAGRVAAERDYWMLTPYGHDPRHAELPDGTDPADLVATGRGEVLAEALANARPLADRLVDERFVHLPANEAALEALRVTAATPPERWETGTQDIAERLDLPASVIRTALKDVVAAWNRDPRAAAEAPLRDINQVKTRLARDTSGLAEIVKTPIGGGAAHERQAGARRVTPRLGWDR